MLDQRIFPRLPDNCDVQIQNKHDGKLYTYHVQWWSDRTYSFSLNGKTIHKSEQEVADLIKKNKIIKLNNGDADRVWENHGKK